MAFKSMFPKKPLFPKSADATEELVENPPNPTNFSKYLSKDKNGLKAYTKKHRRPYGEE